MIYTELPTNKKYQIIYADPPWEYKDTGGKLGWGAEKHYTTQGIDFLKQMPIQNIADDNCIMFMWATMPLLKEALDLIESWGFTYKTNAFTWIKKSKCGKSLFYGLGRWTRGNAELCLLATKGKPKRKSESVFSVVVERNLGHSMKPHIVRKKIIELVGDLPRIELFARETAEGWDSFGNETIDIKKDYVGKVWGRGLKK